MVDLTNEALDPWRILFSVLLEKDSDEVVDIIQRTGLSVDWGLDERQAFSHKTRKREYIPRIQSAYDELDATDKFRVSYLVVGALTEADETACDLINQRLAAIGWRIEANLLTPVDAPVRELFLGPGTTHDAYRVVKEIFLGAEHSIAVVDPYADGTILDLAVAGPERDSLSLKILGLQIPSDFATQAKRFVEQYPHISLEIRRSGDFHDRFIIIDDAVCHFVGASIKDAGKRAFFIGNIEDAGNRKALVEQFTKSWNQSTVVHI